MSHRARLMAVALTAIICCCVPGSASAQGAPILPCEIGPLVFDVGDLGIGYPTLRLDEAGTVFQINAKPGISHNYRWSLDFTYTEYEFDELHGDAISPVHADLLRVEVSRQILPRFDRLSRVGVRIAHLDVLDTDMAEPYDETGLGDIELFADIGLTRRTKARTGRLRKGHESALTEPVPSFVMGPLLQTRITLPSADEEYLGLEGPTIGARLVSFWRWNEPASSLVTQKEVSVGLGYVLDVEQGENSYISPVVGFDFAVRDRWFFHLDIQGTLHDSGVDEWDANVEVNWLVPGKVEKRAIFLHVGARVALNDDGLRDDLAPSFGVRWMFGTE